MSTGNQNTDDDIGFQKYVANRLSPLSDVEFEVLRSLIWGCTYKEYFDPKQFSEKKYENVVLMDFYDWFNNAWFMHGGDGTHYCFNVKLWSPFITSLITYL